MAAAEIQALGQYINFEKQFEIYLRNWVHKSGENKIQNVLQQYLHK